MVAILEVGAFISSLMVGKVGDIIGRRKTILYGSLIFVVGGALQSAATSMTIMMVGRVLAGLGVGALSTIVPVYQSEISPPHNRGLLLHSHQERLVLEVTFANAVLHGCSSCGRQFAYLRIS
jgi:MFS family permease